MLFLFGFITGAISGVIVISFIVASSRSDEKVNKIQHNIEEDNK